MNTGIGERIPTLDGLRGIAILLVMFHHFAIPSGGGLGEGVLGNLSEMGADGVDLFFVLSGFLITGILLDRKESPGYFRIFYLRRSLRIFPLYYIVVAFCVMVLPALAAGIPAAGVKLARLLSAPGDWPWYICYASNFLIAFTHSWRHPILGVTWSLAIEEQFYLAWAIIVFRLTVGRLRALTLWMAGLALVLRCVMLLSGFSWIQVYVLTWCRMDGLALGAWIAISIRNPNQDRRAFASNARAVALGVTVLLVGAYATGFLNSESTAAVSVGFSVVSITCAAWLYAALFANERSLLHKVLSSGFLRFFGKYSYAIYLFHLPVRAALRDTVAISPGVTNLVGTGLLRQLVFYVTSTIAVIPLALLSWKLLEHPILKLKDRFAHYSSDERTFAQTSAGVG